MRDKQNLSLTRGSILQPAKILLIVVITAVGIVVMGCTAPLETRVLKNFLQERLSSEYVVNNLGTNTYLISEPGVVCMTKVERGNFDVTLLNANDASGLAIISAYQRGSPSTFTINNTVASGNIKEEPKITQRTVTNVVNREGKISQELVRAMEKSPDEKLQVIIQSVNAITQSEADQVIQAGAQILSIREHMIVAKATSEQINKIVGYKWVSLIGLDVRAEAQETPAEAPKTPFVTSAALIFALLLICIWKARKKKV